MATYCNLGDKPKVYFQFGTKAEQIYQSNESPIDVSMEDFSLNTPNYNPNGYRLYFFSTNNGLNVSLTVRDYNIIDTGSSNPDFRYILQVQRCGEDGLVDYLNIDPSSLSIDSAITCPESKPDKQRSRLHIKKAGETADIFTTEGDYPGKFRVACSDCPKGSCRCECDSYPGYCCIDCTELKTGINAAIQDVKRLNYG